MSADIGVAVIGCGGMGSWHAANVARRPGATVVAVADVVPDAARIVADQLGARVDDGLALIHADDVDAVIVASSDETHADFATAAIAAGKRCFLEKPLGTTMGQAGRILDAEVAAGRRLIRVGFMRELDPAHVQVRDRLADLGPISRVRSVHRNVDRERRSVDILFSQSIIHDIHTIRWLSDDEIRTVRSYVVERPDGFRDIHLVCQLVGGGLGLVDFEDQAFGYEVQVEVSAVGGMAATLPHPRAVTKRSGDEFLEVGFDWFGRFEDAYRREIERWVVETVEGCAGGPSVWDGYVAQAVADAAQRSIRTGDDIDVAIPVRPELYGE